MFLPSQIYDGVLVLESTENEDKEKKVKWKNDKTVLNYITHADDMANVSWKNQL